MPLCKLEHRWQRLDEKPATQAGVQRNQALQRVVRDDLYALDCIAGQVACGGCVDASGFHIEQPVLTIVCNRTIAGVNTGSGDGIDRSLWRQMGIPVSPGCRIDHLVREVHGADLGQASCDPDVDDCAHVRSCLQERRCGRGGSELAYSGLQEQLLIVRIETQPTGT